MPIAATDSRDWGRRSQQSLVVIAAVLAIGSLHLAKSAVVPILFAVFLAMLLSPAVTLARRLGVPRALAAGIVVASLIAVVGVGLNATWRPALDWLGAAPHTFTHATAVHGHCGTDEVGPRGHRGPSSTWRSSVGQTPI